MIACFKQAAVGKKVLVYLAVSSDCYVLQGDYQSEGRNILESSSVLVSKKRTYGQIVEYVVSFHDAVSDKILNSYAVKLCLDGF